MCLKSMLRIYSKEEFIMAIFKIIKNTLEGVYNTKIEWARIPDGVTAIESNAFEDCKNLKSIIIPDSVKTIGRCAFRSCRNLESIVIPDGVTVIGDGAFWNCESLKAITIPDGVKTIGRAAFWNCSDNLKELVFEQLSEDCDFDLEAFEKIEKPQDDLKISDTEVAYGYAEMMFGEDSV